MVIYYRKERNAGTKPMKLGARILKTGIAIVLALYLATWLGLPTPVFAGIAAVFAIQPSIYRSFLTIVDQVQANIIGAALAITFGLLFGTGPVIIGLTAVMVIAINLKLKIEHTIPIALVTVIAILESAGDHFLSFALIRTATVVLGVLSSFLVNLIFLPPKYETKLVHHIMENTEEILKWIRLSSRQSTDHSTLKDDIDQIKERMIKLDHIYLLYKEERSYLKKTTYVKSRKLVLFRQAIMTSNRALYLLKKLHKLENEIHLMPEHFRESLTDEIDYLLYWHERTLMKFVGKMKPQDDDFQNECSLRLEALTKSFIQHQQNQENDLLDYNMLNVMSSIIEYRDELEHLDTLITSFQTYHPKDSEIETEEKET